MTDALAALEGGVPAVGRIKQAVSAWKRLPNPERERLCRDVIFMSCAGFLAANDMASFGKIRSGIDDMEAFQTETTEHCRECGGSGIVKSRCSSCNGSGRCSRCGGSGRISAPRLSGMGEAASMSCSTCHGSGVCPNCNGGTKETRHNACNGSGKRISQQKCLAAFETHRAKAAKEVFAITQEAKGLGLRNGKWIAAAEAKEDRDPWAEDNKRKKERRTEEEQDPWAEDNKREEERRAEEERKAEEKRKRDKEFAEAQRARGLVLIGGEWMTPGSRRNGVLTVMQKLQIEGWTMRRDPSSGEHGGLLCLDSVGEVGCIIVSDVEWDNVQEGKRHRFDHLYRCGNFSYTTKTGEQKTVRLYATDLDAALEEMDDQRYSRQF